MTTNTACVRCAYVAGSARLAANMLPVTLEDEYVSGPMCMDFSSSPAAQTVQGVKAVNVPTGMKIMLTKVGQPVVWKSYTGPVTVPLTPYERYTIYLVK